MKIVITTHTYYPQKSGVQAVTEYLAEGLVRKGHEVVVITSKAKTSALEEEYKGIRIYRCKAYVKHTFNRGDKVGFQNLLLEKCQHCDVLVNVCSQTVMTDWTFPLLDDILGKKVLYLHGMINFSITKEDFRSIGRLSHKTWNCIRYKWYYYKNKTYFSKYDIITQLNRFDYGYIFFKKKYDIKSIIIENAADDVFFEIERKNQLDLPPFYIICVANYIERKNQKMVLEAFYKSKIDPSIVLIFIGSCETDYYRELQKTKKNFDICFGKRKVIMLTEIPRENIAEYTRRAQIYLMGSLWEAFPISIVESMASGVPFISTDVGCVRYLPGGVTINSIDEMVYWIELLLENKKIRECYGNIGRIYALKKLTVQAKVDQFESMLKEIT